MGLKSDYTNSEGLGALLVIQGRTRNPQQVLNCKEYLLASEERIGLIV